MKMTVYDGDRIVSIEEIKGFIFNLISSDETGNSVIGFSKNDVSNAEICQREIVLCGGKSMLLQTRHAPDLQPIYDIMDGYKGLILVEIRYKTSRVTIEW